MFINSEIKRVKNKMKRLSFIRKVISHPISIEISKSDLNYLYNDTEPRIFFALHQEYSIEPQVLFLFKKANALNAITWKENKAHMYMSEDYIGNGDMLKKQFNNEMASNIKYKLFSTHDKQAKALYLCFDEDSICLSIIHCIIECSRILNTVLRKKYLKR